MSKRAKRERESILERRRPHREERRVYLVVCEGETEKAYFDGMKRHPDVRMHTVHARKSKHPQREVVVRSAAEAQRDEYTEVWAVFDTDGEDVTALVAAACRDGVEIAHSTPTFETWLILHFRDHRSALVDGARAEGVLKALLPRWTKGGTSFTDFAGGAPAAHTRSRYPRAPPGPVRPAPLTSASVTPL
ncbi:RloB family protein [Nocardiopsis sp. NPDC058631]|uniref:RloB family protein n=1 Tax=Nocardiopsis sp. NPDC058631 TaxID=3346566 RepID=UPI00365D0E0E